MIKLFLLAAALLMTALPTAADDASVETYVKVEARGILRTGIAAIGGETTGTVLETTDATLELDLGKDKKLREAAGRLDKKPALVTGTLSVRQGVEVPTRIIVKVESLKAAAD